MEQGWSLSEIWFLSFFFVGIGVALLYVGVRFYFGVGPALVASLLGFALVIESGVVSVLWNPSLQPPLTNLAFLAALVCCEGVSWRRAVVTGVASGFLIEAHPVGVIALPALLLFPVALAPSHRKGLDFGVVMLGACLGTWGAISGAALEGALEWGADAFPVVGLFLLMAVGVWLARVGGGPLRSLSARSRGLWLSLSVVALVLLANGLKLWLRGDYGTGPRYFFPALPALSFLSAALCHRFRLLSGGRGVAAGLGMALVFFSLWGQR
ncbi:MAG: hypothetical protein VX699_00870, partial [Myxococcota bacterium]|nr:hypothetical protein [Myxococcota bacterium]